MSTEELGMKRNLCKTNYKVEGYKKRLNQMKIQKSIIEIYFFLVKSIYFMKIIQY